MSQKTLFTKSALAVAVALISTQAWSAGFQGDAANLLI